MKIVTTNTVFADMIKNIGGEKVEIKTIVPNDANVHHYKVTHQNVTDLEAANVIFINGIGYEGFFKEILEKNELKNKVVVMSEGVTPILSLKTSLSMDKDPHAWLSIYNAFFYIHTIKKNLCRIDTTNKDFFEKNYDTYRSQLMQLENELFEFSNKLPMTQRVVISSHRSLAYFCKSYNLQFFTLREVDDEKEAYNFMQLRYLLRSDSIETFFSEKNIDNNDLETLVKENNGSLSAPLFVENLSDSTTGADSYINLLRYNTKTIVEGLLKKNSDIPKMKWWQKNWVIDWKAATAFVIAIIALFLWWRERKNEKK